MSSPALPLSDARSRLSNADAALSPIDVVAAVVQAFASLKLTVTLFALGIFVVLVGTLAQQEANIGQVVSSYFHAWVMWVDVNLLFPKMFLPWVPEFHIPAPGFLKSLSGGFITNLHTFPAPGGLFVGSLMAINLLAAHGWRFGIQAKGMRLLVGLVVLAIGLAVGVMIIWAGHNSAGFQSKPPFSWEAFWTAFLVGSGMLWCALVVPYFVFGVGGLVNKIRTQAIPLVEVAILVLAGIPLVAAGVALGYGFFSGHQPDNEAIRIVWQLLQGGLAGLILLAGCILVFRKRGGMVLLHLGIGLLIFNDMSPNNDRRADSN